MRNRNMTTAREKREVLNLYLVCPFPVLEVRHHLLHAVRGLLGVISTAIVEVGDLGPVLEDLFRNQFNVYWERSSARPLPSRLTAPAAANLVQLAGWPLGNLVAAESQDEGGDIVRLEGLDQFFGQNASGHLSASVGGDGVCVDVVLGTFQSERTGEPEDTGFLVDISNYT